MLPPRKRIRCRDPFAGFKFTGYDLRMLPCRASREKKPGIESSRAKWWSQPTANINEIIGVQSQIVMVEQLRPGHSPRIQIVQERSALPFCKWITAAHQQYAERFKQLTCGSANCRPSPRIVAMIKRGCRIVGIKLPTRESVKAAQKSQLLTPTDKKDFGSGGIVVGFEKNDGSSVFRSRAH